MPSARGQSADDQFRIMWRVAGMAFMLSAEVAAGAVIGWLIDGWAGTDGRWLTICALIGLVVGMSGFIRAALRLSRSTKPTGAGARSPQEERHDRPQPHD